LTNITAGTFLNFEYTYNSAQQITQIIESTASLGTRTSAFQYDARDQLTEERFQVSGVGCQNEYIYDLARNRVSAIHNPQSAISSTNIFTYVEANKLQSIADEDVAASDADNDGLTRDEEISYGSDPNNADTDDDGLNDNVEVNTYNTCPWKVDSDSDNIPDNTDSNPLKPDNCVWFGASASRPHAWWINSPSKPVYGVGSNKYNYVYDIAGNLRQKTENSTIITRYYYNAQNKLVKITGNGFTYEFLYDSQNRRIALSHNGTLKKIIHAGNIPIGELDSTNGITRWFVRGLGIAEGTGDVIAEIDSDGDAHFYLSNHRGDTVVVLNENASQETYLQYDAFGNVVTNMGTFEPKYTFSTKEYLADAQNYLYRYRIYDPIAGRWTQIDPIDYQDSINLYQFCGNNPVNGIDVSGLARVIIKYRIKEKGKYKNEAKPFDKNTPAEEITEFMESLPDHSITSFQVSGHANKDWITIDDVNGENLFVSKDGKFTTGKTDFTDVLKKKLTKNARIHLKGCSTAGAGNNLVKQVSKIFSNVEVKGAYLGIPGINDLDVIRKDGQYGISSGWNVFPRTYKNGKNEEWKLYFHNIL